MALPIKPNQAMIDALRALSEDKGTRLLVLVGLINDLALYVVGETPMTAKRLSEIQNSLYEHKTTIQSKNLVTLGSRTFIAEKNARYANAAAVTVDIQAASTWFDQFTTEIEKVLVIARASNKPFIDNEPSGKAIKLIVPEKDMTALRSFAATAPTALG